VKRIWRWIVHAWRGIANMRLSARQRLVIFVIVMLALAAQSWRTETIQTRGDMNTQKAIAAQKQADTSTKLILKNAHDQALHNYKQCLRQVTNTRKINSTTHAFIDFLSGFVRTSPNPKQLEQFIAIYRRALLTVPNCGARP